MDFIVKTLKRLKQIISSLLSNTEGWTDTMQRRFPDDFLFGVSTSAYQIEGGWASDGKGPSIWDHYLHKYPDLIQDGTNGDTSADSYNLYERDVEMLKELGVNHYRFSISWSRVFPTGLASSKNEAGFKYYDKLIDLLLENNIQPMITLYHNDLPQLLQDKGGWLNPEITSYFEDYSKEIFYRYSSKVKYWITINQPSFCMETYGSDSRVLPLGGKRGTEDYVCVKHVLLAHAKAYRVYEREFKKKDRGSIGISLSINWFDPVNNSTVIVKAAEQYREFVIGLFIHPIWSKNGDFPPQVKEIVARNSRKEGLDTSRLPKLRVEDIKLLKGSADFIGMNHYTTFLVQHESDSKWLHFPDQNVKLTQREEWMPSASPWLKSAPYGLYKACLYLNSHYDYPAILITEHGWSRTGSNKQDSTTGDIHSTTGDTHSTTEKRDSTKDVTDSAIDNMKNYLNALLLAIEDGTEVKGYTAWSLMDNFEWFAGYIERFGLYEVDFESPNKTRTPRPSAYYYKNVIRNRIVDENWQYKNEVIHIKMRNKSDL